MDARPEQGSLERQVLVFMGAFSQLQIIIDWALEEFVCRQMPALGPLITKHYLRRIRDDERLPCLFAMAADIGYSPPLPHARFIFDRAKETRDLIGHSPGVDLVWRGQSRGWEVAISRPRNFKGTKVPPNITPETFERLRNDCEWLEAHVNRIRYEAGAVDKFMNIVGEPAEPPTPPELPEAGEPMPPGR